MLNKQAISLPVHSQASEWRYCLLATCAKTVFLNTYRLSVNLAGHTHQVSLHFETQSRVTETGQHTWMNGYGLPVATSMAFLFQSVEKVTSHHKLTHLFMSHEKPKEIKLLICKQSSIYSCIVTLFSWQNITFYPWTVVPLKCLGIYFWFYL